MKRTRQAWECALLLAVRDEIKIGNVAAGESKRFGNFDHFFVEPDRWEHHQDDFFRHDNLPIGGGDADDDVAPISTIC